MRAAVAVVALLGLVPPAPLPAADATYAQDVEQWRLKRQERLKAEDGWLSVVGLHWLKEGSQTIGSAPGSGIPLPASAPARLGVITLTGGKVTAWFEPDTNPQMAGQVVSRTELRPDVSGQADVVTLGSVRFQVIQRGDRLGVRVRDAESPRRKAFGGTEWYPVQDRYRVVARFVPYSPPKPIPIANIIGQVNPLPSPGAAVFTLDGREIRLDTVLEEPDATQLFVLFKDATAPRETYGSGRYLYAEMPKDGKIVLDFNKAYSPPCAFTDFATCPLPPTQNRLDVRIVAGEKKPAGH